MNYTSEDIRQGPRGPAQMTEPPRRRLPRVVGFLLWGFISVLGAVALAILAQDRKEPVNSLWLITASACIFLIGYRFYSAFLTAKVMVLDNNRATPAERLRDGHDFEPTNKWIVFGHHFAAIAGPGPLVGPTLAAQFGYLPGALWIMIGCVLGGAVQDFVVLFCSIRRNGKSLGQMAREEIGKVSGFIALLTVLLLMIIILAVVGLVVVNALKGSPWGTFTIAATMPIAVFMGLYLRYLRPGKVLECSALGFVLVVASIFGGQMVANSPTLGPLFTLSGVMLVVAMVVYGFMASALPVWLLLAPRGYLSTFVKLGVVLMLGAGVFFVHPQLQLPAFTRFVDGNGPIFAGKIFPFCFITIACGAVSGFHSLVSSGTTPKMLARERHARAIGYGSMLMEGFVAIMALVAAASLAPGVFFAVNSPAGVVGATPAAATATITNWGFAVTPDQMQTLANNVGEKSLYYRTGGAPSLALGMAQIFAFIGGNQQVLAFWYHFAIMFEALFILTIMDTGTRVGRFMLQDLLGDVWPKMGQTNWTPGILMASGVVVAAWGYFLYQGVLDPLGGINSLWPLFGISNQLLAAVAFCVGTTILVKMHGAKYMWVTCVPLVWLVLVTFTAGLQKLFSDSPTLGFLAQANQLAAGPQNATTASLIFNARLDAVVTAVFLIMVAVILVDSIRVWVEVLRGTRSATLNETPFVQSRLAEGL
jgi:carbon starvation protein